MKNAKNNRKQREALNMRSEVHENKYKNAANQQNIL